MNQEAVQAGAQTDLDELGIPKNTREEKIKARSGGTRPPVFPGTQVAFSNPDETKYNEEMAKLYRQHVLGEQETIQIQRLNRPHVDRAKFTHGDSNTSSD